MIETYSKPRINYRKPWAAWWAVRPEIDRKGYGYGGEWIRHNYEWEILSRAVIYRVDVFGHKPGERTAINDGTSLAFNARRLINDVTEYSIPARRITFFSNNGEEFALYLSVDGEPAVIYAAYAAVLENAATDIRRFKHTLSGWRDGKPVIIIAEINRDNNSLKEAIQEIMRTPECRCEVALAELAAV